MQAIHQAAAMLPQRFNRILNLTVTIQPVDLLNDLSATACIF